MACNEEGWLRPRAGQEPLRIARNENDRHREIAEDLVDRFETRAAVGELNIGEDKPRPFAPGGFDGFAMRALR
jgi:hypothetical protein